MIVHFKCLFYVSWFLTLSIVAENVYDGYKVYDINLRNQEDLNFLNNLEELEGEERALDFWSLHNNLDDVVRVMVKPDEQNYIENEFKRHSLDYKITIENVQANIDRELEEHHELSKRKLEVLTFDRYYRHNEINKYLESLDASTFPHAKVEVKNVGKSYEGRDIKIIKISNGDGQKKNSIFIDAGIHAREWIAPATALYLINQLVDSQSNYSQLLNQLDFIIQPVVNPDGYEFTFKRFRLWRKTRAPTGGICSGVDANRNYNFHWNEGGSSNNRCADNYHGPKALSEIEAQISRNIMDEVKENCKFFLTLHSYGNYLLYPWGYTNDLPSNWQEQEEIAKIGADAIRMATNTKYTVGSASNVLYIASGM